MNFLAGFLAGVICGFWLCALGKEQVKEDLKEEIRGLKKELKGWEDDS